MLLQGRFRRRSLLMLVSGMEVLKSQLKGIIALSDKGVAVENEAKLRESLVDRLIYNAVFHSDEAIRELSRYLIRGAAIALGAMPASIQGLYDAMGKGEAG